MRLVTKRFEATRSRSTAQPRRFEIGEQFELSGFRQSPDGTVWTFRVQDGPEFEVDASTIADCTERVAPD
jgi:hypothetical protein